MTVRLQRWGNSLGVRVPAEIARRAAMHEGAEVEITLRRGRVFLRPAKAPSLAELLAQMKPGNRPELLEWGAPVGREVW